MKPSVSLFPPLNPYYHYSQCQNMNSFAPIPLNFCIHYSNVHELGVFKNKGVKLEQDKEMSVQHRINDAKLESGFKVEEQITKFEPDIKSEASQDIMSQELTASVLSWNPLELKTNFKTELEGILRFLLSNIGKDNEPLLENTRQYYSQNQLLLQVYDKIRMKYYSARKCKEDIIRYILRKAFRSIRTSIMKEKKINSKKASLVMSKRYFYKPDDQNNKANDFENEEELLESLMPFNKNSKNKTMNISFILEIFTSQSFCEAYQQFLPEFNLIILRENKQKEDKLVNVLIDCIQTNNFLKLSNFTRLPWTDVWIEDAKNIAIAIMPNKRLVYNYKKPKV